MSSAQEGSAGAAGTHAAAGRDHAAAAGVRSRSTGYADGAGNVAAYTGRLLAGTLMIMSGLWSFFVGLAAILRGSFFISTPNYLVNWNITGWGWTELIVGVVVFAAGVYVMLGMVWARVVGVILATISAVNHFIFLPHYPLWSLMVIALDVFVIWALCVRVREPI